MANLFDDRSAAPDADDDERNPGQDYYDREFNDIARHYHDTDGVEGDDSDIVPASQLADQEERARESSGDQSSSGRSPERTAAAGAAAIGAAEAAAAEDKGADFNFDPNDPTHRGNIRMVLRAATNHKKGMLIGGGATAGLVAFIVVIFLMLIPLKLESIVSNLQNRFFASSENAVQNETENLFSGYIKKAVLPALSKCNGSTIDKGCNPEFGTTSDPIQALYKGWSNARLENKLATDYGIEFKAVKSGSVTKYYMKTPGTSGNGEDITRFSSPNDTKDLFQEVNKATVRQNVRDALQSETRWKKVMYRYKVGRLLEEKYGVKRCILFCGTKDALQDHIDQKKNAFKISLIQRVITPRNTMLGVVLQCITDPNCDPEKTQATTPEPGSTGELEGMPENPEVEGAARTSLQELAASYGLTDKASVDKMINDYKNIDKNGYQKVVLDAVLEKLGLSEISDNVSDAAPVVGWVNMGSKLIASVKNLGPKIRKLAYDTNSTAAVDLFEEDRAYVDEIHTGHVDATEVGSIVDSLSPGNHGSATDPQIGGTAGAEGSPLYQSYIDGSSAKPGAQTASSDYKCNNGKAIPSGDAVCPEEVLGQGNALANSISAAFNTPPLSYISTIAGIWQSTVGKLLGAISGLLGKIIGIIPGVSNLTSLVSKVIQPFFNFVVKELIPNPFSSSMSGARIFDMTAAGADVAGNDFAEESLGAPLVTAAQAASIQNQQATEAKQQFASLPLLDRIFSTDSQYSLLSRFALDMPSSATGAAVSFGSIISSPFSSLSNSFASILNGHSNALGGTPETVDPFKVGTHGFVSIPSDPEAYWNQHCSDNPAQAYQNDAYFNNTAIKDPATGQYEITNWNQLAAEGAPDPNTGMPVHRTPNYCLLIKQAVGSAGGLFDTSLLTQDDLADLSGGGTTPSDSGTYQNPFRDIKNLTRSRVDQGVDYLGTGPVYALGGGQVVDVEGPNVGWETEGYWIAYKLTAGPAQGKYVYMAEDCTPNVKTGDTVTSGTVLCNMFNGPSGIETGWADDPSAGNVTMAHDVWIGHDSDSYYTAYGQNFSQMLQSLQDPPPPGTIAPGAKELGELQPGWPTWQ